MPHYLGIDARNSRVRLVRFKKGLRELFIDGFAGSERLENSDPETVAPVAAALIREHELESDRIILGLSEKEAYVRTLYFPFSKKDKIGRVLPLELESYLPSNIQDMTVDFQLIRKGADNKQGVLTASLDKEKIGRWVEAFREQGVDLEIVDLDLSVLRLLAEEMTEQASGNLILWDIGEEQSSVIYAVDGHFAGSRFLNFGFEEKDPALDMGDRLRRELGLLLWSLQSEMPETEWNRMAILGQGANLKGMDTFLARESGLTVTKASDMDISWLRDVDISPEQVDSTMVAAGLALRAVRSEKGFNFRKDGPAGKALEAWKVPLKHGAVGLLILFLAWIGTVGMDIYFKKQRLDSLEAKVDKVFRRIVPEPAKSLKPFQYASVVQSRIDSLKRGPGGSQGGGAVLELLLTLSQAVSQDMNIMVQDMTVTGDRAYFSGTARSYEAVNVLKGRLDKAEGISSVSIEGVKTGSKKDNVQFTLSLERGG